MNRGSRYFFLLILTVTLYLAISTWHQRSLTRPYPQVSGELTIQGLTDTVIIKRDKLGIPHIYAQNTEDLFLAQGYVHAQDRFWQMEFWRYASQGRISELVGPPGLEHDRLIRTISGSHVTLGTLSTLEAESPEVMSVLDAYARGVNQYLDHQNGNVSYNYTLLSLINGGWDIERWTPFHSVAWGTLMAHDLSENYRKELKRLNAFSALDPLQAQALLPEYLDSWPTITPSNPTSIHQTKLITDSVINYQEVSQLADHLVGQAPLSGFAFGSGDGVGSNSWVVAGEHTTSGAPLLANDPHLLVQMPSIWYQIGLHSPEYDVVGFSFAGAPGVVVGHNGHIGWGITNLRGDVQDLYVEKVNPDNPYQYEFDGDLLDMDVYEEQIDVRFTNPVTLTIRRTHRGPIISDVLDDVDLALSLQWTVEQPSYNLKSILMLNQAQDYDSFNEALSYWGTPGQNFVYADIDGNIAYQAAGVIPIRKNGRGVLPVPGWNSEYEWVGFVPYEEMPHLLNPEEGYIVTANNAAVDHTFPYFIAYDWALGDRAARLNTLLVNHINSGEKIDLQDMANMQLDGYSQVAEEWVPHILHVTHPEQRAEVQIALDALRTWDYVVHKDSVATSVFELFYWYLLQNTINDELGDEQAEEYVRYGIDTRVLLHKLANDPTNAWWDNVNTDEVETRDEIIQKSTIDAVNWLIEHEGSRPENWQWHNIHQITFNSLPLGEVGIPFLSTAVNRGPYPVGGGQGVVNEQIWKWDRPVAVINHPSMRMIFDFADMDQNQAILSTGQSGHPGHINYDDMMSLWLDGKLHPMPYSQESVEQHTVNRLILQPRN